MQGEYLKKPLTVKQFATAQHTPSIQAISCQMQGWRSSMEDSHIMLQISEDIFLFAVFDGHGGFEVAHFLAELLPSQLQKDPHFKVKAYKKAFLSCFKKMDELLLTPLGQSRLKQISKRGKGTDHVGEKIHHRAGSTALIVLITPDTYFCANVGDSRAVLCRQSEAIALSEDHKPSLVGERERIENAGGTVRNDRVNGSLGLSRAFGDYEYKKAEKPSYQQMVISVPDVLEIPREIQSDKFILLACDGVWERYVFNNRKMVSHIDLLLAKYCPEEQNTQGMKLVLEKLFDDLIAGDAREFNGCDNMTAILIYLLPQ